MELAFTTSEKSLRKTYRHFTIPSDIESAKSASNRSDFFYIGKKTSSIDTLIRVFETGYAAENIENAQFILQRLFKANNIVPGILIIDGNFNNDEISSFHNFIVASGKMAHTPFVVDATDATDAEIDAIRKLEFVDEILMLTEQTEQHLYSKIRFLKKVKLQGHSDLHQSIETSVSKVCATKCFFKRSFDIVVSSMLLLLSSPVLILIAFAIKIESKGPVFYISKRAGRGYKVFDFFKFRTMFTGADLQRANFMHMNQYNADAKEGPVFFKINNDPRITKVGLFLRNTSLDELPQLLNVLLGDMSLVGNRPLPLYEAATLTTDEWAKRFMAPAGITGLWQIKKRGQEDMSVEERLNLDIDYAEKYNFMYDLWIMANTPSALIQKTNA